MNNSSNTTHPVGEKKPNAFGLYDMLGHLHEWCEDAWHKDYNGAPIDGSAWMDDTISDRVCRGGTWESFVENCRSTFRRKLFCSNRSNLIGMRVTSSL